MTIRVFEEDTGEEIPVTFSTFPGGEEFVRVGETKSFNCAVHAQVRNSQEILRLIMLLDALSGMGIEHHLLMPYVPYARQDRRCNYGEAHSMQVMGDILSSQVQSLSVVDIHSQMAGDSLPDQTVFFKAAEVIGQWPELKELAARSVIVAPDKGAEQRAFEVASLVGAGFITCKKVRNQLTTEITGVKVPENLNPDVHYLIVDDICDGGRTFLEVATALRANGATKVSLYVTHGIFSKGVGELSKVLDSIWTTNSFHDRMIGQYNEMEVHFFDVFKIM